jgi:hypothetical protein
MKNITLILFCAFFFAVGCNGNLYSIAHPQKGGIATLTNGALSVSQPENSAGETSVVYEREMIPIYMVMTNTNALVLRETYKTVFGEHQADEARANYGSVQKLAVNLKSLSSLYYIGGFFMLLGVGLMVLKTYFPIGIKVPLLSICMGAVLCLIPSAMSDSVCRWGIVGIGIVVAFIVGRKFEISTTSTTETTK